MQGADYNGIRGRRPVAPEGLNNNKHLLLCAYYYLDPLVAQMQHLYTHSENAPAIFTSAFMLPVGLSTFNRFPKDAFLLGPQVGVIALMAAETKVDL